ncbi:MAG TPA: hypothetical protein VJ955_05500 [Desulfuromonadales bacterium]|nr:hypothetical protein [Desulfuromonadales bacterium]
MKAFVRATVLLMSFALVSLQIGCTLNYRESATPPDWIVRGSGAFKISGSDAFYGVGSVRGIDSRSKAEQIANLRARGEIANQLDLYTRQLYHDYRAATLARTGKPAPLMQYPELTLGIMTETMVRGVQIVDTWKDRKTDTVYSLASLEFAGAKASLSQVSGVTPEFQRYIRSHAEKTFDAILKRDVARPSGQKDLKGK